MADGSQAILVAGDLALHFDLRQGARVTAVTHAGVRQGSGSLVERWWCGYTADGQTWSDAPLPGESPFESGPVRVRKGGRSARPEVVAQVVSPHLRVEKRFTLYPELPFVRVRYRVETTGVEGRGPGLSLGLPAIRFHDVLADPFDLQEDTADDGLDLGGGLALPAWRVFADPDGAYGLVVFAAERQTMSRLQVTERGCAFRPSYYLAYSTEVVTTRELRLGLQYHNYGPLDEVDWFLGAYRRETLPRAAPAHRRLPRPASPGMPSRREAGVQTGWPGEWGGEVGVQPAGRGSGAGRRIEGGRCWRSARRPPHILPPLAALPPPWPGRVSWPPPPAGGRAPLRPSAGPTPAAGGAGGALRGPRGGLPVPTG